MKFVSLTYAYHVGQNGSRSRYEELPPLSIFSGSVYRVQIITKSGYLSQSVLDRRRRQETGQIVHFYCQKAKCASPDI